MISSKPILNSDFRVHPLDVKTLKDHNAKPTIVMEKGSQIKIAAT